MKVSVIGGGAIGLLVSYFLKINNHEPIIYTRTAVQADHLNRLGITYKDQFGLTDNVPVQSIPVTEFSGKESHCVITVKQTSIHELAFL
jgi:2-dehydropantoate 2-reductase